MYYAMRASAPSLLRESTDSQIRRVSNKKLIIGKINYRAKIRYFGQRPSEAYNSFKLVKNQLAM